ncbi:MAG TPA: carbon starvation CstA family protein, partial [Verrucomicrobiae bacterium]|nr:carbon starvation CstA family protein [Verrucomicrobiae bacterium]
DYLSTFMKLGTIFVLALGVLLVLPRLQMPAVTRFIDGTGPVVPGKLFPFCFITIACGAISGFHTLISSGITPKIITRESYARPVGYGAMCLESLVAIMAMIAACTLDPGVYLAMNIKVPGADAGAVASATVAKVSAFGPEFTVTAERMAQLASDVREESLYGRTGGAATLAVGMANLFAKAVGEKWLAIWYHFALMFEALFILTTLDAGTRVGRYLLQDAFGRLWKPLGEVRSLPANLLSSGLVVAAWGYFLIAAVYDPDGGIKALWPIFGIANQLLAATALCLATTVILKMQLQPERDPVQGQAVNAFRHPAFALVTFVPLAWLLIVTGTAAVQKIWHSSPGIGFLAKARQIRNEQLPLSEAALEKASAAAVGAPPGSPKVQQRDAALAATASLRTQLFNNRLDAAVTGAFLAFVVLIFLLSVREWVLLLARKRLATLGESEPVWLAEYAVAEGRPLRVFSLLTLAFALAKELSGEAALDRAQRAASVCCCLEPEPPAARPDVKVTLLGGGTAVQPCISKEKLYLEMTERRYRTLNRCC